MKLASALVLVLAAHLTVLSALSIHAQAISNSTESIRPLESFVITPQHTARHTVSEPEPEPVLEPEPSPPPLPALPDPVISAPPKTTLDTRRPKTPASTKDTAPTSDVRPPSSQAKNLNNPHPPYPRQSRRMGEQGQVVLSVEIAIDGSVTQIQIKQSSGHPRLDASALETVHKWRFIPGKRAGMATKMWVNIPINFVLN